MEIDEYNTIVNSDLIVASLIIILIIIIIVTYIIIVKKRKAKNKPDKVIEKEDIEKDNKKT